MDEYIVGQIIFNKETYKEVTSFQDKSKISMINEHWIFINNNNGK